jgi:hypothetical protein
MSFLNSLKRLTKPERDVPALAAWLKWPEADLRGWLTSRPPWTRGYDYRRFSIPKRRGGVRQIEAPGEKLKDLQRRVHRKLLAGLPMPACATGYVARRSIVDNARPHAGQGVVINLDLADFFPSISTEEVQATWQGLGWNDEAARILAAICTSDGHLPQGAPTSPALSNLVCRRLDARLSRLAEAAGGHYTRYADDLTFSFAGLRGLQGRPRPTYWRPLRRASGPSREPRVPKPGPSWRIVALLLSIIKEEGFSVQWKKKIRIQRPHQRQTATGLVVNQKVNLPRAQRRLIRAMQHHARLGKLDEAGKRRLAGLLNFQRMVEEQRGARNVEREQPF